MKEFGIVFDKIIHLTGDQIAEIPADKVASFAGAFWDKVPVYQIAHLSAGALQAVCKNVDSPSCQIVSGWDPLILPP